MIKKTATVCFFVLVVLSVPLYAQNAPQLVIEGQQAVAVSFAIDGNPDSWYVYKENSPQPLFGKRELRHNDTLAFRPAISFQQGITYVIKQNGKIIYKFSPPEVEQVNPQTIQIYPTSESLPANLLKFYIQFSEPMAEGDPYDSVHLIDAAGDTLTDVFLKQLPALWNKDRTILSLWLDPGRIKRDLNLNQKLGMPLEGSERYRLVIDTTLKSSHGLPLESSVQKKFSTISEDRQKPNTELWNIDIPKKGTTRPLVIHFKEAMDYLSTRDRLEVLIDNKSIQGESIFRNEETEWVFTPTQAWQPGSYSLRADARMEDIAGNNLNRLFDRDAKEQPRAEKEFYSIEFIIR